MSLLRAMMLGGVASRRPAPQRQWPALPPYLPNDADGGDIHSTLPPDQVIPKGYDINWWRGAFGGVLLPDDPASVPLVPGCNTTPQNMMISFLLPWYWQNYGGNTRPFVDKILTAHAIRNLSHFHLDLPTALSAGLSFQQFEDMLAYVQSWGFFTSAWKMGTTQPFPNWAAYAPWAVSLAKDIEKRGLSSKHVWVVGEELNSYVIYGEDGLDNIIRQMCALQTGMKIAGHFTVNEPCCYGGDVAGPVEWFAKMAALGYWGNLWQGNADDTVGAQGAHLWDTKWRMALGSPSLKLVGFELSAEAMLYGRCDEGRSQLKGWSIVCNTNGAEAPNAPPIAGVGDGLLYPDGMVI